MALDDKTNAFFNYMRSFVSEYSLKEAKKLVLQGIDINAKSAKIDDRPGSRPLHLAVRRGDLELVELLLEKGARVDLKRREKITVLHDAMENNTVDQAEIVEALVKAGAKIEAQNERDEEPLIYGIKISHKHGRLDGVRRLMELGASFNAKNSHDITLLVDHCVDELNAPALKLLAHHGLLRFDEDSIRHFIKLAESTRFKYSKNDPKIEVAALEAFDALLAAGGSLKPANKPANPLPLLSAIENGAPAGLIKRLAEEGPSLKEPFELYTEYNQPSDIPLKLAYGSAIEPLKEALKWGLSPNWSSKQGTSLLVAAIENRYSTWPSMVNSLLEAGADPNQPDGYRLSPLVHAMYSEYSNRSEPLMQMLLKAGASPNESELYKTIPPLLALWDCKQLNQVSYSRFSRPLMPAQRAVCESILFEKGADANCEVNGDPLFFKVPPQYRQTLIEHGVDDVKIISCLKDRAHPAWLELKNLKEYLDLGFKATDLIQVFRPALQRMQEDKYSTYRYRLDKNIDFDQSYALLEAEELRESLSLGVQKEGATMRI